MTWGEANHIHHTFGHAEFLRRAYIAGKTEMFIRNVCNNNQCQE